MYLRLTQAQASVEILLKKSISRPPGDEQF